MGRVIPTAETGTFIRKKNHYYIEFQSEGVDESRDLDENTIIDLDNEGNVCAITFEHASSRTDVEQITLEGIAA